MIEIILCKPLKNHLIQDRTNISQIKFVLNFDETSIIHTVIKKNKSLNIMNNQT